MNVEQKCRTCLTSTQQLESPFTVELVNDKKLMYSEMIFLCTNVQVNSKHNLNFSVGFSYKIIF